MARFIAAIADRGYLDVPGAVDGQPWDRNRLHFASERAVDFAIALHQADYKITTIRALDVALLDSFGPRRQPPLVLWVHERLIGALRKRWERGNAWEWDE